VNKERHARTPSVMEKMETRNGTDRIMGNEGDDFFLKSVSFFLEACAVSVCLPVRLKSSPTRLETEMFATTLKKYYRKPILKKNAYKHGMIENHK
jgi:hypothetical protein